MIHVCGGCGRMIEKQFIYCPWCGAAQIKKECHEYQERFFEQAEERQRTKREKQLQTVEKKLSSLEKELDVLVLSAALAR